MESFALLHQYQLYMYLHKVFTGHLNTECFESAVPAVFLSYAPIFLNIEIPIQNFNDP